MAKEQYYEHFKGVYESLLDYICQEDERIILSEDIINIWKCKKSSFLQMISVFFESQNCSHLIPSLDLYLLLIDELKEYNNTEMLVWLNDFNTIFMQRIVEASDARNLHQRENKAKSKKKPLKSKRKWMEMFEEEQEELESKIKTLEAMITTVESERNSLKISNNALEKENSELKFELHQKEQTTLNFVSFAMDVYDKEFKSSRKNIESLLNKLYGVDNIASV